MNNSAFISYRRDAAAFIARAVFQDLRNHDIDVFMDVESINQGQFESIILNQIASRPYFLPILAQGTFERAVDPNDWVRREIEHAMNTHRIIVPLRIPPFNFKEAEQYLTGQLKELLKYNAIDVPFDYFDEAMERLRTRFLIPVDVTMHAVPQEELVVVEAKMKRATQEKAAKEELLLAQQGQQAAGAPSIPSPVPEGFAEDEDGPVLVEDSGGFVPLLQSKLVQGFIAYTKGLNAEKTNDTRSAIAFYDRAIKMNGAFTVALFARGRLQRLTGALDGALEDLNQALTLNPRYDEAYAERGLVYQAMGKADVALKDLDESIHLNPRRPDVYHSRGLVRLELGDKIGALDDLNMVLELDPDNPQADAIKMQIAGIS